MRSTRPWALALLAAFVVLIASVGAQAQGKTATVKIVNKSDWEIHEFYLSPSGPDDDWGPDQLRKNVIAAHSGSFTLNQIPCNTYDVKLVDEDGDSCEVEKVDICGGSGTWTITNENLLKCQKETGE